MALERLQKILARAGVASRREAEKMILEGRVRVNGVVIDRLGSKADPLKDHIKVDGKRIRSLEPKVTLLLNKPKGYVSSVKDPQGRKTVIDLLEKVRWRVYPVGRLDYDAEGLLLLTNDGDLAHLLSHPRFSVPRTYLAKVRGVPTEKDLLRLTKGVTLEDGKAKAASIALVRAGGGRGRPVPRGVLPCRRRESSSGLPEKPREPERNAWVEIVVTEGRNHLVKRMFQAIGHPVVKLKRTSFGPIHLGNLQVGHYRSLSREELEKLESMSKELQAPSGALC